MHRQGWIRWRGCRGDKPVIQILNIYNILHFQCAGLQQGSDPPTWVLGSNLHVRIIEGVAVRVNENESPYAVLGSEMTPLPVINIKGLCTSHLTLQ